MRHPSLASVLSAFAVLALAGCGGSSPAPAPAEGEGGAAPLGGGGGKSLGKKMPEFQPSGIKDDFKKLREAKDAIIARLLPESKRPGQRAAPAV